VSLFFYKDLLENDKRNEKYWYTKEKQKLKKNNYLFPRQSRLQSAIRGKLARLLLTELYKLTPVTMEIIETTVTTLTMEKFKTTMTKLTMEKTETTVTTLTMEKTETTVTTLTMEKIKTMVTTLTMEKTETMVTIEKVSSGQQQPFSLYDYHVYHFNLYYSYALFHYQYMYCLQRQIEEQRRFDEQLLGYFDDDKLFIPYQYDDFE
jgi:uncharacterized ParB-like nuclease family protein